MASKYSFIVMALFSFPIVEIVLYGNFGATWHTSLLFVFFTHVEALKSDHLDMVC